MAQYRFDAADLSEQIVTTLADNVMATLRMLIEDCVAAEADTSSDTADAGAFDLEYPLSPSQTGMWLQSVSQKTAHLFVEQAAFCLEGTLDVGALTRALDVVVARHAALRSAIACTRAGNRCAASCAQMSVSIHESETELDDEDAALSAVMAQQRSPAFELDRPPLIRFALLRTTRERAWLVLSFHHIILDGWSLPILLAEAEAAYEAELHGKALMLPSPPNDADFAAWLKSRSPIASEAFWRSRLAGFTEANPVAAFVPDAVHGEAAEFGHFMTRRRGCSDPRHGPGLPGLTRRRDRSAVGAAHRGPHATRPTSSSAPPSPGGRPMCRASSGWLASS